IYNFNFPEDYKLKLTVGDAVHILEEETNWYYGYIIKNRHVKGIFPKSYIHIKPCEAVNATGPVLKEPPITQEITSVLREWGLHWKMLYVQQVVVVDMGQLKQDKQATDGLFYFTATAPISTSILVEPSRLLI
ncbi:hypothetical protein NQ317_017985, partial [Molorchus minor]